MWSITAADNDDADAAVPWAEGMLPGAVNNSARGLMAGVARLLKDLNGSVATTGSSNTYAVTSNSGHTTYTDGTLITAKANHTNTAAATLNLNTYGAKNIHVFGPVGEHAAFAGQIQNGGTYQFRYDSAADSANGAWILLNPTLDPTRVAGVGDIKIWPSDTLPTGWAWSNGQALDRTTYAVLFGVIGTTYGAGDGSTTFNVPDLCGRAPFGSDDMGAISAKGRITNAESSIVGTTLGASGGAQSITLATTQIPSHAHTAQNGGAHTHTGGTSGISADHSHVYNVPTNTNGLEDRGAGNFQPASGGSGGNIWFGLTTGNTSGVSVGHTHTFTTDSDGAHTHTTDSIGGGLSHSNMPPALIVNYVIKT